MISLYEYLGYPAGSALGKRVFAFAKLVKASHGMKNIPHSRYKNGQIITYDRSFLDLYFKLEKFFLGEETEPSTLEREVSA
jgi:hypothetical protein